MRNNQDHLCPVCGYAGLAEPPHDADGNASFEICPSCGTEFGYDDATKSAAKLRMKWLRAGAPWWSSAKKAPRNWNPIKQLLDAKLLTVDVKMGQAVIADRLEVA